MNDDLQTVFIPNVSMSTAVIINCDLPDRSVKRYLTLEIDYDVSIESVERILYAGALNAVGVKFSAPPVVRATELKDTGVIYEIAYTISDMRDRRAAEGALIKSVLGSLRVANITIASEVDFDKRVKIANRSLDVYHLAQQVRLFSGLPHDALNDLTKLLAPVRYAPSAKVVVAGEIEEALFIVAEGILLRADIDAQGNIFEKRFVATEFFGVDALVSNLPHRSTVVADTDALLYKLDKSALHQFFSRHPETIKVISANLASMHAGDIAATASDDHANYEYKKSLYEGIIEANYK